MRRLITTTAPYLLLATACASVCEKPRTLNLYASQSRHTELLECLESDESWIREETALALGGVRTEPVRQKLEALLLDRAERPWVRAAAADALGRLAHPASFEVMTGLLAKPGLEPESKVALIEALCRYADRGTEAVQSIAPLENDEDLVVAALAAKKVSTTCGR